MFRLSSIIFLLLITLTVPCLSKAIDTIETWDKGATDVEMYLGFDGMSAPTPGKQLNSTLVLGYGIINYFSIYTALSLSGNMNFADGRAYLFMGIFGTPVDTKHFDLDLFFDVSGGGSGFSEFKFGPALEMNFDVDPGLQIFGLFLRAGLPVYTRETTSLLDGGESSHEAAAHIDTAIGMYFTVAQGFQFLAKYNMAFHFDTDIVDRTVDVGGISVGCNIIIHPSIELITELFFNIPGNNESFSSGVMVGFVGTIAPDTASVKTE